VPVAESHLGTYLPRQAEVVDGPSAGVGVESGMWWLVDFVGFERPGEDGRWVFG
jgi:hypothetical protein